MHNKALNILVIDDNKSIRYLTVRSLRKYNSSIPIIIHELENGQEGINYLSGTAPKPDVILLDINMPVMNGLEFLEEYSMLFNFYSERPQIYILSTQPMVLPGRLQKVIKGQFEKPLTKAQIDTIFQAKD